MGDAERGDAEWADAEWADAERGDAEWRQQASAVPTPYYAEKDTSKADILF